VRGATLSESMLIKYIKVFLEKCFCFSKYSFNMAFTLHPCTPIMNEYSYYSTFLLSKVRK
jgi:hypothetical protein